MTGFKSGRIYCVFAGHNVSTQTQPPKITLAMLHAQVSHKDTVRVVQKAVESESFIKSPDAALLEVSTMFPSVIFLHNYSYFCSHWYVSVIVYFRLLRTLCKIVLEMLGVVKILYKEFS